MAGKYQAYPEYKDSGVEWLGDVPKHWNARQLKFLCSYNDGFYPILLMIIMKWTICSILAAFQLMKGLSKQNNIVFGEAPYELEESCAKWRCYCLTVRTYFEANCTDYQ